MFIFWKLSNIGIFRLRESRESVSTTFIKENIISIIFSWKIELLWREYVQLGTLNRHAWTEYVQNKNSE